MSLGRLVSNFLNREDVLEDVPGETGILERPRKKTIHWIDNADKRIAAHTDLDPIFYDDPRALEAIEDALERGVPVDIVYDSRADLETDAPQIESLDKLYENLRIAPEEFDGSERDFINPPRYWLVADDNVRMAEHSFQDFEGGDYPAVFMTGYQGKADAAATAIEGFLDESYEDA